MLTAALATLVLLAGCAGVGRAAVPNEAAQALQDAAACSDELAERYQKFAQSAASADAQRSDGAAGEVATNTSRTFETAWSIGR